MCLLRTECVNVAVLYRVCTLFCVVERYKELEHSNRAIRLVVFEVFLWFVVWGFFFMVQIEINFNK